ncbi:MAG: type IV toxin-antitoxin system AbiEi family antitoxin [Balneolaceae bacterium]
MDRVILNKALEHLAPEIGRDVVWKEYAQDGKDQQDAQITFDIPGGGTIVRHAIVRKEIRKHHIPQLEQLQEANGLVMLVAERLFPDIKKRLNEVGIDWMDVAGNIRVMDKGALIWIDRHTTTPVQPKGNRAFTKTGLKVVFLFLYDEAWLNHTYREIAQTADVALGNIKFVLDGLNERGYLLTINENEIQLKNHDRLLDQWLTAFADELKPRILKGRYQFVNREAEQNWKKLKLGAGTMWGGEPAADLMTQDLKPEEFILYTRKKRADLMNELKLVPDKVGNVEVREPYWTFGTKDPAIAPMLTIYTDLMETGDPRNMKIAKQIYARATED